MMKVGVIKKEVKIEVCRGQWEMIFQEEGIEYVKHSKDEMEEVVGSKGER